MTAWETQLRKGVVELAVLATISRGGSYGYQVVEQLRRSEGFSLTESTVYPVLTRLSRDGSLAVRTETSPSGPPRRYYRLTPEGRARLGSMAAAWKVVAASISTLIEGANP